MVDARSTAVKSGLGAPAEAATQGEQAAQGEQRASTDAARLAAAIKACARDLGFDLAGITTIERSAHAGHYNEWLRQQRHGAMEYLARPDAVARRLDPRSQQPELRSAIVVGLDYGTAADEPDAQTMQAEGRGIIARYARGRDYHKVIRKKLLELLDQIEQLVGHALPAARAYVDTGPVLERELAQRAGLGWFGRNTMLINPKRGSFFFLGTLLVELELTPDTPFSADHCGTCQSCVNACPTGALLGRTAEGAPVMNATRCISYLTIENRGSIPRELRPLIGNRIFGCDICQEVCPFTRKFSTPPSEPSFAARGPDEPPRGVEKLASDGLHPGTAKPSLIDLMALDEAGWEAFSRGSALRRAGRAGFLRNVAVALGNWGSFEAVPVLAAALSDPEPLVRGHAAWALGKIASPDSLVALKAVRSTEREPFVLDEVDGALDRLRSEVK